MTKPRGESENTDEILTVRIGAQISDQLDKIAEGHETKSEGYREVIERGIEAYNLDRTPNELRDRVDELERELSRSIWDRLDWSVRIMLTGAILTAVGLVPIIVGVGIVEYLGHSFSPGGYVDNIIAAGILAAVTGVIVFMIGGAWVLLSGVRQAIAPDIE